MKDKIIKILKGYSIHEMTGGEELQLSSYEFDHVARDIVKLFAIPVVMPSALPDPQQWFMDNYDVDVERMQLIEHNGNDVVNFIYTYLNDLK